MAEGHSYRLNLLIENRTLKLDKLPVGRMEILLKWVFKIKVNPDCFYTIRCSMLSGNLSKERVEIISRPLLL
jgi:hypothetical protein